MKYPLLESLRQIAEAQVGGPIPRCMIGESHDDWATPLKEIATAALAAIPQWQPIDTAPVGKRVLVQVPIKNHRLVIGLLTKEGLWLDELMQPMAFTPFYWMQLPAPKMPETTENEAAR